MNRRMAVRWWPPIGIAAMVLLGLLVGRGTTTFDQWFLDFGRSHRGVYLLLIFTDARLVVLTYVVVVGLALYRRRWRLAVVVAAAPVLALVTVRILKRVFGREKIGQLAYPSGHVTVTVTVLGLLLLVIAATAWMVAVAVVVAVLGLLGQAVTFHYFTDTMGAVLLATSVVCLAALAAGLDRCQPRCDLDHSRG